MVDLPTVCCMCGDVGFPDKLFRCNKCRHRFQHFYCSNYYSEFAEPVETCDWCQSEERNASRQGISRKSDSNHCISGSGSGRSEYSGDHRIVKQEPNENNTDKGNNNKSSSSGSGSGVPSPRTATRRYKLLKDVMC